MGKATVGIDITGDIIKFVSLERFGDNYTLQSIGLLNFKGDKNSLKQFVADTKISGKDCRINIDDVSLKIRRLDLPLMPDAEILEAAKWGLKDTIDGEVDDFSFRYTRIDPENIVLENKIPLIVFAVKKEAVDRLSMMAREVGLRKPSIIEPNGAAMTNVFDYNKGAFRDTYSVMIDLGQSQSFFTVMGKKGLIYSRPLSNCAEKNMIEQIMRDVGIDKSSAGNAAKEAVLADSKVETDGRVQNSIDHFFSNMAIEIQRSIDGYMVTFDRAKISNVYLCGRGAYYKGLVGYLQNTLGLPVSIFDPFEKIDVKKFNNSKFERIRSMFTISCGLAIE